MNVCKVWEVGEESRPSTSVKATYTCPLKKVHYKSLKPTKVGQEGHNFMVLGKIAFRILS